MGTNISKFSKQGFITSGACAFALFVAALWARRTKATGQRQVLASSKDVKKKESPQVNGKFFGNIWSLLKIMIPGVFTAEMGFVFLSAAAMVARTYCDVWQIKNGTAIERSIITRDVKAFREYVTRFISLMLPISIVNAMLRYSLSELHLRFRTRLTQHLYKYYLKGFTYYQISNIDGRIGNVDQTLTQDVDKFCQSMSELYSNISKPILDIFIYSIKLTGAIGLQGPTTMLIYLLFSGVFLTAMRKPVSRYTVDEQRLEGEFRAVNTRMITNSEEIAFYGGNVVEANTVRSSFGRLVDHLRKAMQFRFSMGVIDNMIAKYWATVVGYWVVSRPFLDLLHPRHLKSSHSEIMEDYYQSGRMLMNLASAVGRLVLAGRELTRLAGFTQRVTDLVAVLKDLEQGKFVRTMVTSKEEAKPDPDAVPIIPNSGKIVYTDHLIRFEKVPIVTPNGDILVRSLSFEVKSGINVLITGPNGCGKSSLFRILGELWPLFGGTVTKPEKTKLFYIPQRPYMTLGTLRDQIIYPHTSLEFAASGKNDANLRSLLKEVHLEYLADREGGFDAVNDWMDVLSGGEKQRIAMARLFYHAPQFAILDECTSAVSVDVEGFLYSHCKEMNITLFTVSHRKTLWKYHEYMLVFDGRGAFEFKPMTAEDQKKALDS